jgi:hypothetical protein
MTVRNAGTFVVFLTLSGITVHRENWPWLWTVFIIEAMLGLPIFYYAMISGELTSREVYFGSENRAMAEYSVYLGELFFLMIPVMRSRWLRLLAIAVFSSILLTALIGGKRGQFFHAGFSVLLLLFIMVRTHGFHYYLTRILPKTTVVYGMLVIVGLMAVTVLVNPHTFSVIHEIVTTAYEELGSRMTQFGSTNEMLMKNERWAEIDGVVSCMSSMDWVFGKGLAGVWSSPDVFRGQERDMVHNTWLNCFFWGGAGLFLVVAWPILWSLRVIFFSKSTAAMCCAAYMLLIYWKFPFYDISKITPSWILFSLMIGACRWESATMSRPVAFRAAAKSLVR